MPSAASAVESRHIKTPRKKAAAGWLAAALVCAGPSVGNTQTIDPADGETGDPSSAIADQQTLPPRADPAIAKLFEGAASTQTVTIDNADYADFLSTYVVDKSDELNLVRYGDVSDADKKSLKDQIVEWEAVDATKLTRDQKFVYFVNLYNAETLDVVLDHYPVKSIRDIKIEKPDQGVFAQLSDAFNIGPWSDKLLTIDGTELSLDEIEHSILRPMGDNRVHYAINCASIGCPDLKATPWTVETLDADLDAAAANYIGSERGLHHSTETDGLLASKIYSWFDVDFGGNEAGVLEHLRKYAPESADSLLNPDARITSYRYDWSLNDARTL